MASINEDIYNEYFGKTSTSEKSPPLPEPTANDIFEKRHPRQQVKERKETYNQIYRQMADGNIDDIEQLALILKKLCNAAWGADWGELSPDLKKGEDSSKIILPQITIDINTRDIAVGLGGLKPILLDVIDELDEEGKKTGDAFLMYRQWFDCNIEFDIYGRTNQQARQLQRKFENLLMVYTGYLKRQGISEMLFEKEVSPKNSLNYDESVAMRCIYYYIRFESIIPIRQSLINSINIEIGASKISADKVKTLISSQPNSDLIELDFFDGDNGITFEDS